MNTYKILFPVKNGKIIINPMGLDTSLTYKEVGKVQSSNPNAVYQKAQNFNEDWSKNLTRSMCVGDRFTGGESTWEIQGTGIKLV